jgi:SAM-dependent methyltransferase
VVNVGAGAGAYEPRDRWVLAVEPSETMIAQRPPGAAPVVRATAEALPLADATVDAAMAVLTVHHWSDWRAGVAEMMRVARSRVVVWSFDPEAIDEYWLVRDYLPEIAELDRGRFPPVEEFATALGGARVEHVPIPRDCRDGVLAAFYARPERYLDPVVRAGMSPFAVIDAERAMARLADDLRSGAWDARWGHLRDAPELEAGYRLFVAER